MFETRIFKSVPKLPEETATKFVNDTVTALWRIVIGDNFDAGARVEAAKLLLEMTLPSLPSEK